MKLGSAVFSFWLVLLLLPSGCSLYSDDDKSAAGSSTAFESDRNDQKLAASVEAPSAKTRADGSVGFLRQDYAVTLRQISVDIPDITAWVEVVDDHGNPFVPLSVDLLNAKIEGLPDVKVVVDGITPASDIRETPAPQDLIVLMDVSGSMAGSNLVKAKGTVEKLIDQMVNGDRMAISSIGESFNLLMDFTNDRQELRKAVAGLRAVDNKTLLYDGICETLDEIRSMAKDRDINIRKSILVFSDGMDDGSKTSLLDTIKKVQDMPVPIFAVGYRYPKQYKQFANIQQIVDASRGQLIHVSYPDLMVSQYRFFRAEAGGGRLIRLSCPTCPVDSSQVKLTVSVSGPKITWSEDSLAFELFQSEKQKAKIQADVDKKSAEERRIRLLREEYTKLLDDLMAQNRLFAVISVVIPIAAVVLVGLVVLYIVLAIHRKRKQKLIDVDWFQYEGNSRPFDLVKIRGNGILEPEGPYRLPTIGLSIGRDGDIRLLGEKGVKDVHCRLVLEGRHVVVTARWGCRVEVNGQRVRKSHDLRSFDKLLIGRTSFSFELLEE